MGGVFNYVNLHVYHYAGNNPVKYIDPDGRLQRDSEGNLIFTPEGDEIRVSHPSGRSASVQPGWLYADDGTRIEAFANREESEPGFDTDCHGFSFADGQYWINNWEVQPILDGDGYENRLPPKVGDIVVYFEGRGVVVHSAKIVAVRTKYNFLWFHWGPTVVEVEGISGVQTEIRRTTVENGWLGASHYIYYRKSGQ